MYFCKNFGKGVKNLLILTKGVRMPLKFEILQLVPQNLSRSCSEVDVLEKGPYIFQKVLRQIRVFDTKKLDIVGVAYRDRPVS